MRRRKDQPFSSDEPGFNVVQPHTSRPSARSEPKAPYRPYSSCSPRGGAGLVGKVNGSGLVHRPLSAVARAAGNAPSFSTHKGPPPLMNAPAHGMSFAHRGLETTEKLEKTLPQASKIAKGRVSRTRHNYYDIEQEEVLLLPETTDNDQGLLGITGKHKGLIFRPEEAASNSLNVSKPLSPSASGVAVGSSAGQEQQADKPGLATHVSVPPTLGTTWSPPNTPANDQQSQQPEQQQRQKKRLGISRLEQRRMLLQDLNSSTSSLTTSTLTRDRVLIARSTDPILAAHFDQFDHTNLPHSQQQLADHFEFQDLTLDGTDVQEDPNLQEQAKMIEHIPAYQVLVRKVEHFKNIIRQLQQRALVRVQQHRKLEAGRREQAELNKELMLRCRIDQTALGRASRLALQQRNSAVVAAELKRAEQSNTAVIKLANLKLQRMEEENRRLKEEVFITTKEKELQGDKYMELQNSMQQLTAEFSIASQAKERFDHAELTIKTQVQQLQRQLQEVQEEHSRCSDMRHQLSVEEKEHHELKLQHRLCATTAKNMQKQLDKANLAVKTTNANLVKEQGLLAAANTRLMSVRTELLQLTTQHNKCGLEFDRLEEEIDRHKLTIDTAKKTIANHAPILEQVRAELAKTQQTLAETRLQASSSANTVEQLEKQLQNTIDKLNAETKRADALTAIQERRAFCKTEATEILRKLRPFMGIMIADLSESNDKAMGVLVTEVDPGSPAACCGLAPRDVIVELNGIPLENAEQFVHSLGLLKAGDSAPMRVLVSGKKKTPRLYVPRVGAASFKAKEIEALRRLAEHQDDDNAVEIERFNEQIDLEDPDGFI